MSTEPTERELFLADLFCAGDGEYTQLARPLADLLASQRAELQREHAAEVASLERDRDLALEQVRASEHAEDAARSDAERLKREHAAEVERLKREKAETVSALVNTDRYLAAARKELAEAQAKVDDLQRYIAGMEGAFT